jgi:hypothetical protein
LSSKVRVVARNTDGTGCVVLYTAQKPDRSTLTDDQYFIETVTTVQNADPSLTGKTYVDTMDDLLPPLNVQAQWRIVSGQVIYVPT